MTENSTKENFVQMDVEKNDAYQYLNLLPIAFTVIRVAVDEVGDPIDFICEFANEEFATLESQKIENIIGKSFYEISPDISQKWLRSCCEVAYKGISKEWKDYNAEVGRYLSIYCYQPKWGYCACVIRDITYDIDVANELKYLSEYDDLTSIYNKQSFYDKTHDLLMNNFDTQYVIGRIDIEKFKIVNDVFGTGEGDQLLKYIARKIKYYVQDFGTYGRLDADIFAICFPWSFNNVERFVDYMQKEIKQYPLDFEVIPCFGFYVVDVVTLPVDIMCDRANLALRTIKGNYVKRYAVYDDTLRRSLIEEQSIVSQMNNALVAKQFKIYLQPKCKIDTGNIVGAEALVRWQHPMKGLIPPNKFIPIFEKNGFILKLDAYVWECACELLRKWLDEGREVMPISVNVSRINLYNPKLCDILIGLIEKYQLQPELLQLELTESAYTENQKLLVSIMERLRTYGFKILMDDFGSGYSSLNVLKDLPVDILKIDLKFLSGIDKFGRGGNILASVIRMARWLSLPVIAEGVETREQADFLISIACNVAQGYYFSRPITVEEYERLLDSTVRCDRNLNAMFKMNLPLEDLWNYDSPKNVFFNTLIGAVAIYELCQDNLEVVRANDDFFKIMQWSREDFYEQGHQILNLVALEDRKKVLEKFYESVHTKETIHCEFRRLVHGEAALGIHMKVRFIAGNDERFLFYAAMERLHPADFSKSI